MDVGKIVEDRVVGTIHAHDLCSKVIYHDEESMRWILSNMVESILKDIAIHCADNCKTKKRLHEGS